MSFTALPSTQSVISFDGTGFVDSRPQTQLLTGAARFLLTRALDTTVPALQLVPDDYVLRYAADEASFHDRWFEGPRGGFLLETSSLGVRVTITAMDQDTVQKVWAEVQTFAGEPEEHNRRVHV